jgi:hypothetical protein
MYKLIQVDIAHLCLRQECWWANRRYDGKGEQDWRSTDNQQTGPGRKSLSGPCSEHWGDNWESPAKMIDEICTRCPRLQVSMGVTYEGLQEAEEAKAWSIAEPQKDDGKQGGGKPVG